MEQKAKKFSLSLIVPVLNEQEIIAETIEIFLKDLSGLCDEYELIVVNDGSTDNTQNILKELAATHPKKLKVITNRKNLGSGRSLINGFKCARFDLVATNFADRPFNLKELKNILPLFLEGADFVVVYRRDRSANSLYRKITSLVNYYLIRFLFKVKVSDFQFVQVYRKEILDNMTIAANHTFVPPEIIIKALHKGYKMREYKSIFYRREKGRAKCAHPKVILNTLCDTFKFWVKLKILKLNLN